MLAPLGRVGLVLLLLAGASPSLAMTLTTMNVRFYGLNANESREPALNRYLDDNSLRSDVMVFQEIVDVERLKAKVVGLTYACTSYESTAQGHQHVVVCLKDSLKFEQAVDDDNFVLEDVAMGNVMWRPAVHGIIKDAATGRSVAHLVAVHLKAMPEDGEKRVEQIQRIHDYLAFDRADSLPAIIVGDTNLFDGDVEAVDRVLTEGALGLMPVQTPGRFTYRVPAGGQKFDRIWLGPGLAPTGPAQVAGPCNLTGTSGVAQIRAYNRDVSDHCAVVLSIAEGPR